MYMIHTPLRPKFFIHFALSSLLHISWWTTNHRKMYCLHMCLCLSIKYYYYYYNEQFLSSSQILRKIHEMPLTCLRSKVSTYMLCTTLRPRLSYTSLNNEPIDSMVSKLFSSSSRSCLRKRPQGNLNMFDIKVKCINGHTTYTPKAKIFICFTARWEVFGSRPKSELKITLTCSRSEYVYSAPKPKC